jgi:hypothetical protein
VRRDLQVTQQEILPSNKLQGKKRTSVHDQTRFGACEVRVVTCDVPHDRTRAASRTQGPFCLHTWEIGELRSPDKAIGNKGRTYVDRRRRACVRQTLTRIGLCRVTQDRTATGSGFCSVVLCSPSLLTARERDSSECGNLLYLKERELVDQRGSFLCAKRDLDIVCAVCRLRSTTKVPISFWRLERQLSL